MNKSHIQKIDILNAAMILFGFAIYSSMYRWGLTIIEADGMQLFLVLFIISPILLISGLVGLFKYRNYQLLRYSLIPIVAAIGYAAPIIDRHITYIRGNIALSIGVICFILLLIIIWHNKALKDGR